MKPHPYFAFPSLVADSLAGSPPVSGVNKEMVQLQTQVQQLQEQMTACSAASTSAWA